MKTKLKNKIISAVLTLCIIIAPILPSFATEPDVLHFNENGEFKILHICDGQDG